MDPLLIARRRALRAGSAIAIAIAAGELRAEGSNGEKEVEAAEDLMREHGVLRRVLLVYSAAASRLRGADANKVPAIEERYVFPSLERLKGEPGRYPKILQAQHDRGRAITDYITSVTRNGSIASADRAALARAMDAMVLMYQHHTACPNSPRSRRHCRPGRGRTSRQ